MGVTKSSFGVWVFRPDNFFFLVPQTPEHLDELPLRLHEEDSLQPSLVGHLGQSTSQVRALTPQDLAITAAEGRRGFRLHPRDTATR